MSNIFISLTFSLFTILALLKIISYALYEINQEKNKFGGIILIIFSFACLLFGNIMFWIN